MKLLVDARLGWGHGIGRVVVNTVPRIAQMRPAWQIDVLVGPADVETAAKVCVDHSNLKIISCPIQPFSIAEQLRLERYAKGYDLTWFTNYWVPLTWRGRFVVTVHDLLHLRPRYFPSSRLKRLLARRTFAKCRRDAEAIIFISRFTQREFNELIGEPRRGQVIQLGGDHLDYGVVRPVAERRRQLVIVAASKKHKNFEIILHAWQRAAISSHWTLKIVSSGTALRSSIDIDKLVRDGSRIDLLRGLSDTSLVKLYSESAILLMPSLYEGFGLPLLEGILSGAICISSNAGALVEVGEGSFVQFVNGSDLEGWTRTIEKTCAMIDQKDPCLAPLSHHNLMRSKDWKWDDTAADIVELIG